MDPAGLAPWLRLARAEIPYDRKLRLAEALTAPPAAVDVPPDGLVGGDRRAWLATDVDRRVASDLDALSRLDVAVVTLASEAYPALLRQIPRPPLLLVVRGHVKALTRPQIAMVGSRNASHAGRETAADFAAALAAAGLVVTSGLALGVDGAAHAGCLDAGGPTIGVAATGPDRVYPVSHTALARRIADGGGAVVTEFLPGDAPRPHHFPRRNRIIAGLSLGTLVVEAAVRSGSLITARHALEQGREVFAIPGSIHNPAARGCHRLIRDGAKLVECVDDILEELSWAPPARDVSVASGVSCPDGPSGDAARVLSAVDHGPTDFDTVVRRTGLQAAAVSTALLELEMHAWVCKSAGFFSRRR